MSAMAPALRSPEGAVREAVGAWGFSFAAIVVAFIFFRGAAKVVATAAFLFLPMWLARKRGEDSGDYGLTLRHWKEDLKWFSLFVALIVPLFFGAFWGFAWSVPHLPPNLARAITPLSGQLHFSPRLPPQFWSWVVDQIFVVALPEEFFYRGFIQARLSDAWPTGRRIFGVRIGRAFLLTAVLFALGHLAVFQVWRLAVFFPALLFGWMREKTGTVVGAAGLHAFCNLYEMFLESSLLTSVGPGGYAR